MTLAGKSIFGDIPQAYSEVSIEEVVQRDPEVIWIMSESEAGPDNKADKVIERLLAEERLADVTAVKNRAFVTISFADSGISTPRNIDALEPMVEQLETLR